MAESPWVEGLTIGQMLRQTAARYGDREAVVFSSLDSKSEPRAGGAASFRLTYREFDQRVDRVARALIGLGIEKGEHVAVWATNWPHPTPPADQKPDDAMLLDVLLDWVTDETARRKVLVDNPAKLYA